MARDITTGFDDELDEVNKNPCILVKAEFDGGDLLLWSGYGSIDFNGDTYSGAGQLMSMSPVQETQELRANNVTFGLTGLDAAVIATGRTEDYSGRPITAWFGLRDSDGQVPTDDSGNIPLDSSGNAPTDSPGGLIADPYRIFSGEMDIIEFEYNGENSGGHIAAESELLNLRKKNERRLTPEDQKLEYPGDLGFDFVPTIQDRQITWGAGRTD